MPTRFELANAVRALAMDAVQKANSGHPGMPMGMADIAEVLWNDFLVHNPANPRWADRDRFVVSNGHGSMLLYALLHLSGYALPIEELKNFRQLHSKTPGHPENHLTPGVETTTGPLGQGLANAVGMALAERVLAARFNHDGHSVVDHYTYVFVGDGCLMEGISHEACSLAGTLGLNKLVVFYDDNDISIDGEVDGWFRDDTPARFESYGWQVVRNVDGHSAAEIRTAIETARKSADKPTLICCKTIIGFGSPNLQGKEKCHGAPLGDAEIALAREQLGWPHAPFEIPEDVRGGWDAKARGSEREQAWNERFQAYAAAFPQDAAELTRRMAGELPDDWSATVEQLLAQSAKADKPVATRKASKAVLDVLAPKLPELFGGSADLSESNCTDFKGHKAIRTGAFDGNYVNYGVREFGMSAVLNGIALHGGLIPFGGTFLVFSDYARNALRMAALMKQRSIFVLTHDSIGLGEDGPTHQAVEHVASLRLIPGMHVWRPADPFETAVAWTSAIARSDGPSALALTRQNLPPQAHGASHHDGARRGGYVLWESSDSDGGTPELILIATGSEVQLAMAAAQKLGAAGRGVRVVSMPCAEVFAAQDAAYRESVLPSSVRKRLAVEAGVSLYWRAFVGLDGDVIGVDRFGESAPAAAVFEYLGLTAETVHDRALKLLA
ncbi:transketolase [Sinimarinibacterium flocculans]|uniref:Transketolase n=1 Tax=Sinimarinibacterium flocculans TaxID=985250 RepID=A0A318EGA0_9GAMM|nr:transketolase [Sinimarinibacterium flocculans]PXV69746.1 transketolase [Sinimarinibacterium flocculans]